MIRKQVITINCMHDRDEQCFSDCPDCVRSIGCACGGCGEPIGNGEDCYNLKGDIYCSDCAEQTCDDYYDNLSFNEKLELFNGNRMMWEE